MSKLEDKEKDKPESLKSQAVDVSDDDEEDDEDDDEKEDEDVGDSSDDSGDKDSDDGGDDIDSDDDVGSSSDDTGGEIDKSAKRPATTYKGELRTKNLHDWAIVSYVEPMESVSQEEQLEK